MLPPTVILPQAITVLGTYRCTAACENCCFDSNPKVKGQLTLDQITRFIGECSDRFPTVQVVVFSGGECFLLGRDLVSAVRFATERGLATRCVTNGFWAKSRRHGRARLQALYDAGLRELNVSTGEFHQRFVREETVVNALEIAAELGMTPVMMVERFEGSKVTGTGIVERNLSIRGLVDSGRLKIAESPWMPMNPHATIPQEPDRLLDAGNVHLRRGCKSIFTTLVATPTQDIGFCCGLSRQRIPELNASWRDDVSVVELVEEAGKDFMKIWLFVDGPEKILAWAASKEPSLKWEGMYSHHCHSCLRIFSDPEIRDVIRTHYVERVNDVLMRYSIILRQQETIYGEVYA